MFFNSRTTGYWVNIMYLKKRSAMIQKVQIGNAPQPNNCKSANSGVGKVDRVIYCVGPKEIILSITTWLNWNLMPKPTTSEGSLQRHWDEDFKNKKNQNNRVYRFFLYEFKLNVCIDCIFIKIIMMNIEKYYIPYLSITSPPHKYP